MCVCVCVCVCWSIRYSSVVNLWANWNSEYRVWHQIRDIYRLFLKQLVFLSIVVAWRSVKLFSCVCVPAKRKWNYSYFKDVKRRPKPEVKTQIMHFKNTKLEYSIITKALKNILLPWNKKKLIFLWTDLSLVRVYFIAKDIKNGNSNVSTLPVFQRGTN